MNISLPLIGQYALTTQLALLTILLVPSYYNPIFRRIALLPISLYTAYYGLFPYILIPIGTWAWWGVGGLLGGVLWLLKGVAWTGFYVFFFLRAVEYGGEVWVYVIKGVDLVASEGLRASMNKEREQEQQQDQAREREQQEANSNYAAWNGGENGYAGSEMYQAIDSPGVILKEMIADRRQAEQDQQDWQRQWHEAHEEGGVLQDEQDERGHHHHNHHLDYQEDSSLFDDLPELEPYIARSGGGGASTSNGQASASASTSRSGKKKKRRQ
ncbi:hypothetical protein BDV98DRAFT_42888 [Pterulicium gracile]|uniref:Uncharacterized protein n=1 Tax=Pterulicium gracile TaxID=1884261 RepID=A0A5C3R129_9AGAR|nr:hypothetical protein BDV98DRAFT_42888 [Pterula gracilis]